MSARTTAPAARGSTATKDALPERLARVEGQVRGPEDAKEDRPAELVGAVGRLVRRG